MNSDEFFAFVVGIALTIYPVARLEQGKNAVQGCNSACVRRDMEISHQDDDVCVCEAKGRALLLRSDYGEMWVEK